MAAVGGALVSLRACTSAASVSSAVKVGIIYLIKRGIGGGTLRMCVCVCARIINQQQQHYHQSDEKSITNLTRCIQLPT